MSQKQWDDFFLRMARLVATKSKDRSTKIGAVIVGEGNEVLSIGFNGFPRWIDDEREERHERPAKYMWTEHAERNAIYNAARCGISLRGASIYLSCGLPCVDCARAIIQSGIVEVVIDSMIDQRQRADPRWCEQWLKSIETSGEMLEEAIVAVRSHWVE